MTDEVAAAGTEAAPVVQPSADAAAQPNAETTTAAPERDPNRTYTQAELDKITASVKKNERYRTRKEVEAFYQGRESVRPADAPKPADAAPEDKAPTRDQFDTYEAFIEAKADFTGRKAAREERTRAEKEASERAAAEKNAEATRSFQTKVREKFPDIDTRLESVGDKPIHKDVQAAIQESEFAPDIFNEVITKEGELERLYKLSPTAAVKEIGRLEARFEAAQKKPEAGDGAAPKKEAKPSNAPAPIEPVGGKAVSGDAEPSHNNPEAWAAWRNRQVAARKKGARASA